MLSLMTLIALTLALKVINIYPDNPRGLLSPSIVISHEQPTRNNS